MAKQTADRKHRLHRRGHAEVPTKLPREVLKELMERSGLSGLEIAKQAGYRSASGYYRLMQQQVQGDKLIAHEAIKRLIPVLRGRGNPPITLDELMAISDAAPSLMPAAAPTLAQFVGRGADAVAMYNETGGELLPVRLRVERGVFISPGMTKTYATAIVGVSREFRATAQFVAVVSDDSAMPVYRQGSQLHCVQQDEFRRDRLAGRRVVLFVADEAGPYREVVVARVDRVDADALICSDMKGKEVSGEVAGVVIGAYSRE